eukprot:Hpha_TRINITY_DN15594_c2_g4::TRINITY_DN15594_c2_g4_i1::g.107776::m.107776
MPPRPIFSHYRRLTVLGVSAKSPRLLPPPPEPPDLEEQYIKSTTEAIRVADKNGRLPQVLLLFSQRGGRHLSVVNLARVVSLTARLPLPEGVQTYFARQMERCTIRIDRIRPLLYGVHMRDECPAVTRYIRALAEGIASGVSPGETLPPMEIAVSLY